mmetsp:Transcript_15681/g.24044  ORF Transcript_15681/g.24044 Transcript_15681/m.24044 type:complete len:231 (-) Transcript_15681:548-1240(-)
MAERISDAFRGEPDIGEIRNLVQANLGSLFSTDFLEVNKKQIDLLLAFEDGDTTLVSKYLAEKQKLDVLEKEKKEAVAEEDFERAMSLKKVMTAAQSSLKELEATILACLSNTGSSDKLSDRQVFDLILKYEEGLKMKHAHQVSKFSITEFLLKLKQERETLSQLEVLSYLAAALHTKAVFEEGCEEFLARVRKVTGKLQMETSIFHKVLSEFTEVLEMGFDSEAEEKAN